MDTRALVRHLRDVGRAARRGRDRRHARRKTDRRGARACPPWPARNSPAASAAAKRYDWTGGSIDLAARLPPHADVAGKSARRSNCAAARSGAQSARYRVVAYDFGIKQNILRLLVDHDCDVTVVPAKTSAEDVLALKPDGVFLSNGPGDPEPITYAVTNIRKLLGRVPIFGICLGHQLCGLALGGTHLQIEVRASRLESSGEESAHGQSRDHLAESRLLRRSGFAALERRRNHARQLERPYERGHAPPLAAALQRPVSSGGVARARTTHAICSTISSP